MTSPASCLLCDAEELAEDAVVFRDELWAAEVVPGYEVPGWFILRARRHAELITGLTPAELAGYGQHLQDLVAAVAQATRAQAVYQLVFGENYRHFHALVAARGADVPPEQRGGNLVLTRPDRLDPAAAHALVGPVRSAYENRVRTTG